MKEFEKRVRRKVIIPSDDPAIGDVAWHLDLGPDGVGMRRQRSKKDSRRFVSWRSVIGLAIIAAQVNGGRA
jgi:hypothetical protein